MSLNKYLKKLSFDKRMIDRNLAQKLIQLKDLEQHFSNLEDVLQYGERIKPPVDEEQIES